MVEKRTWSLPVAWKGCEKIRRKNWRETWAQEENSTGWDQEITSVRAQKTSFKFRALRKERRQTIGYDFYWSGAFKMETKTFHQGNVQDTDESI